MLQVFMKMVLKWSAAPTFQRGQLAGDLSSASSWRCSGRSVCGRTSRLSLRGQNRFVPSSAFKKKKKLKKALSSADVKVSSLVFRFFCGQQFQIATFPGRGMAL